MSGKFPPQVLQDCPGSSDRFEVRLLFRSEIGVRSEGVKESDTSSDFSEFWISLNDDCSLATLNFKPF